MGGGRIGEQAYHLMGLGRALPDCMPVYDRGLCLFGVVDMNHTHLPVELELGVEDRVEQDDVHLHITR